MMQGTFFDRRYDLTDFMSLLNTLSHFLSNQLTVLNRFSDNDTKQSDVCDNDVHGILYIHIYIMIVVVGVLMVGNLM